MKIQRRPSNVQSIIIAFIWCVVISWWIQGNTVFYTVPTIVSVLFFVGFWAYISFTIGLFFGRNGIQAFREKLWADEIAQGKTPEQIIDEHPIFRSHF
jgi:hypothetical protein